MEAVTDYRFGTLAALVHNALAEKGKTKEPVDFFPAVRVLLEEAGIGERLDPVEGMAQIENAYERALLRLAEEANG